MKATDPDDTDIIFRKAHRPKRRIYCAKGPSYIIMAYRWLRQTKPFGFCIHGEING